MTHALLPLPVPPRGRLPRVAAGLLGAAWSALRGGGIRILTYHGVCRDEDRRAPWVPSQYVTQSALDRQLAWLRRLGEMVDLLTAARLVRSGGLPRRPLFCVTFDDAPANLLPLALPVLARHGVRATVFAVTDRLGDGGLLEADARQALYGREARCGGHERPVDRARIPALLREALRHMNWDEALAVVRAGHVLGAHTCGHLRLAAAPPAVRRRQIEASVTALRARLGTADVPFAFPYGQATDFGEVDVETLARMNVPAACTGIPGVNRHGASPLRLGRNCVGLFHGRAGFAAELAGLRDARGAWSAVANAGPIGNDPPARWQSANGAGWHAPGGRA